MPRPLTQINWIEFDKLCSIQCTLIEISEWFECSEDTIERAVKREKGMGFADYFKKKSGRGKISLRRKMFESAQSGNVTMMIWLSKNILGYRDKFEEVAPAVLVEKNNEPFTFTNFCETAGYPNPYPRQIEMMEFGMNSEGARMILGSRGYGKTDYVVILGIAYRIYLDQDTRVLIVTKSKERNAAMLREIANACIANGVSFEKQNSSCLRIAGLKGKDHSVSSVTIKTVTLRGRHPDLCVLDDPVTEDDASEATRMHVQRVYNEINKLCGNVLIIGQPVHKFDLYETLRPMLKKMEVPHGSIPELDHDLEAQRLAGVDESSIQASYFLKVMTQGSSPFESVNFVDKFPTNSTAVAFIDPSFEGGDYTAISIVKAYLEGVVVVGFCYKMAWNHCLDDIQLKLLKYNVKRLCFENNSLGDQPLDILRTVFTNVTIYGKKSNSNKHSRIMSAGSFAHMIHLCRESDRTYLDQVIKYEYKSKNDDAPDSLASALEWIGVIRGKR